MKISELTQKVLSGDYPDIPRSEQEIVLTLDDTAIMYYATIVGSLLLNDIPAERAEVMIPKRIQLFDDLCRTLNVLRIGRLKCLLAELDNIVANAMKDKDLWVTIKQKNNICTFITEYWSWDDMTRINFVNGEKEVEPELVPESTDIVMDGTGEGVRTPDVDVDDVEVEE